MPEQPVEDIDLETGLKELWTSFAISANARSIPDVRDGLKPVARRCLYTTSKTAPPNGSMKKCARLVGEVLGKYHPHGEISVYDAFVRLTREWELPFPMFDIQGNFGAIDGSEAAAMRYTESKLSQRVKDYCMAGLDENAVPFQPNYDGQEIEPTLLPVSFPLLIVNGIPQGSIGVGYASAFPVHHPAEVCRATIEFIKSEEEDEDVLLDVVMKHLPGPDFPTGGLCSSPEVIKEAYKSGRGTLKSRASCVFEEENCRIIFTTTSVGVSTMQLTRSIVEKARKTKTNDPVIPEIKEVRDETYKDRKTKEVFVRVAVDVRKGENLETIKNKIYKYTSAESNFFVNSVVRLPDGKEANISLLEMIEEWISFRIQCIKRIASFRYEKASDRIHVLEGLIKALNKIDSVISFIRKSKGDEEARSKLGKEFGLTDRQARAVLQIPLGHLSRMRMEDINREKKDKEDEAERSYVLMTDEDKVKDKIIEDLEEVESKYKSIPRKTIITKFDRIEDDISMIEPKHHVLVLTRRGHLVGYDFEKFQTQHRGTRGKTNRGKVKKQDEIVKVAPAHSHDRLIMFLTSGDAVRTDVCRATQYGSHESGIGVKDGEKISAFVSLPREEDTKKLLFMAAEDGKIRLIRPKDFLRSRQSRLVAFSGNTALKLRCVIPVDNSSDIFLISKNGKGVRFSINDMNVRSRKTKNIHGMKFKSTEDCLSFAVEIPKDDKGSLLFITRNGLGKRVDFSEFRKTNRGSMGIMSYKLKDNDYLACVERIYDTDEILIITKKGIVNRISVKDVRKLGRNTFGCRLQKVDEDDEVVSVCRVPH